MLQTLSSFLKENKIILLVVCLAMVLRFILPSNPPSLNWDEISHGYNAFSILKTGRDEWGKFIPIIFRAYGDYKHPIYIYLTAVSEFFFGLTAFAVRLPSILAGVGTVIFTYLLVKEMLDDKWLMLTKKQKLNINSKSTALLAGFFVAIEPWTLFLSRGAFEANLALFFFTAGIYYFLKFVHSHSYYLLFATLFFGLTVWTYNSYRIFTPLMMVGMLLIYKTKLIELIKSDYRAIAYCLLSIALLFLPMFYQLLNPVGQARYAWVSILDTGAVSQINEARAGGGSRLYNNKATFFINKFTRNYISHFSPSFLFLKGGSNYQFSVPENGLLFLIDLPLLIIGFVFLLTSKSLNRESKIVILFWLILAPIPSSLTREAPHVLRDITALPIPMILSSIGLYWIITKIKENYRPVAITAFIILFAGFSENYIYKYFTDYRKDYSKAWQYGYEDAVSYAKANYETYDKIIITKKYGEPHEFVLFYWPWDPNLYLKDQNLNRFYQTSWYWVDGFDKFYFVNDWQIKDKDKEFVLESKKTVDCLRSKCLLLTSPNNVSNGWNKLETINYLDGKPAFEIYEN